MTISELIAILEDAKAAPSAVEQYQLLRQAYAGLGMQILPDARRKKVEFNYSANNVSPKDKLPTPPALVQHVASPNVVHSS